MMRKFAILAAALAAATAASPARAVEAGLSPYPKGLAGFMSGYVPPQQGLYLGDIYYYYNGSAGADVRGGKVELDVSVTLNVDLLEATYVTDWHPLGGTYAVGAAVDYAWAGLDATIATPLGSKAVSLSTDGFADSLIIPALIGWHDGNFHWSTAFYVYVPTGAYNSSELSVGKNIWAFMPQFAITYFDPKSGWEASAAFTYVTMTTNGATQYASGDIAHLDWGVGLHFGKGWEAGVVGNVVQQVGADRGAGAQLGPNKAQSLGIGPSVSYSTEIGHTPLSLGVKWEHDFDAHNTFEGDMVGASVTVGL
ncbi:MAG: transporter [Rhizomicrobium sp.]